MLCICCTRPGEKTLEETLTGFTQLQEKEQILASGCRHPGKMKCSHKKCFELLKKVVRIKAGKGRMLVTC